MTTQLRKPATAYRAPVPDTALGCANEAFIILLRTYASWWYEDADEVSKLMSAIGEATSARKLNATNRMRVALQCARCKLVGVRRLVDPGSIDRFDALVLAMSDRRD